MSDGDAEDSPDLDPETFESRLDDAEAALEDAETEDELDEVEATLDDIAADLEEADLDAEEDDDPGTVLEDRLDDVREELDASRGPYAEDVAATLDDAAGTLRDTRWTDPGRATLRAATVRLLIEASDALPDLADRIEPIPIEPSLADEIEDIESVEVATETPPDAAADAAALADALEAAAEELADAGLDPDEDAETLAGLSEQAQALTDALDEAQKYDDLTVREQLEVEGFFDSLGQKHKDFPPEWSALKVWEQRNDVEMILLALEKMDSEFMQRHCLESLERMGHPGALDAMLGRAERRDKPAIRVLGAIGEPDDEVLDTLHEFLDGDPALQRVTLRSLGQIGSEASAQPVANLLVSEEETVRSQAARTLGLIGDERAVEPLADVLGDESEIPSVRASAAWALVQIGTERALSAAAEHASDPTYVVEAAAEPAAAALDRASG